MKLNKKLDSSSKQLFKEENEEKKHKSDLEKEKQNLNDLVKFLSKEIDDLRTEISLFKRKGGHIYTMVTSNKKNLAWVHGLEEIYSPTQINKKKLIK